ncbi:MAG: hypothetical protein QM541_01760 [Flavobacterium sp.]|nr:hypothetical protein [Flavobacterium sp.]
MGFGYGLDVIYLAYELLVKVTPTKAKNTHIKVYLYVKGRVKGDFQARFCESLKLKCLGLLDPFGLRKFFKAPKKMKVLTLNIFCFIGCFTTSGQASTFDTLKSQKIDVTKYALAERANFYPFNITFKVAIASFNKQIKKIDSSDWRFGKPAFKNYEGDEKYGLQFLNDTICLSKLTQIKILSTNQVDSLTDILYNTCYRLTIAKLNQAMCYLPHNAILFFDKNKKLIDYIEICLDCQQFKFSNNKIERFMQCDFTVSELKKYFKQMGLYITEKDFGNKTNR